MFFLLSINPQTFKTSLKSFNCKGTVWRYRKTDNDGAYLESWAETHNLQLIHELKLASSFNSGRWKRGYNIFVTSRLAAMSSKHIGEPMQETQHKPTQHKSVSLVLLWIRRKSPLRDDSILKTSIGTV